MHSGPVLTTPPTYEERGARGQERLSLAQRHFAAAFDDMGENAVVSLARVHAVGRHAYVRHVRDPDLDVRGLVRAAFERARTQVNMRAWQDRRQARDLGSRFAPVPMPASLPFALPPPGESMLVPAPVLAPAPGPRRRQQTTTLAAEASPPAAGPARAPPVTVADLRREPLLDAYELEPLPGGEPMQATLVNSVYMAYVAGSVARVPWAPDADTVRQERVRTLSVTALAQGLLGIAYPSAAAATTKNHSFCIRYTAPLGAKHNIFPLDMSVHETAASNDVLAEFAVHLTAALISLSCGLPHVRVARRERYNCVFTSYAPYRIDYGLLKEDYPSMVEIKESHFRSSVCSDPSIPAMKLLVFSNRPVILVGARNAWDMHRAMRFFLPRIYASSTRIRTALPVAPLPRERGGEGDEEDKEDKDDDSSLDWDLFNEIDDAHRSSAPRVNKADEGEAQAQAEAEEVEEEIEEEEEEEEDGQNFDNSDRIPGLPVRKRQRLE